ncbi:peptidoglycan recognition family protein [Nocardiopsis sp. FR26]|uniref:peptidoglycan recognition protein family protein n=1 Tax=Nocardiopsis sp. FR26 TaxID=2605987 RepID=UPI001F17BB16|nr:peptidoglycan recognition family protein [Nocardiopsis sp. FR26]
MIDYPRTSFGWSATSPAGSADPTSGLVVHYNGPATNLSSHAGCVAYWKGVRDQHVNGNQWADIGYSFGVDVCGHIFEGRGLRKYQAAQGTSSGNANWYSVSLMIGGSEQPTAAQIEGVRRLRAWLMGAYGAAGTVRGHRDFVSTSCPGAPLYAMVTDGTFTQAPGSAASISQEDPLIGAREGESGQVVTAIQRLIVQAGQGAALGPTGVDGDWGAKTSEALMLVRQSVGSSVTTPIRVMNGETYGQLLTAMARRQVALYAPTCEYDGSSSTEGSATALPSSETVTITGTLKRN